MNDSMHASLRVYRLEAAGECLRSVRTPDFAIPTLAFPVAFYVLFALVLELDGGGMDATRYYTVSYGVFGVIGPALFGFGATIATERDAGWLLLKRASPMPTSAYFIAKMIMSGAYATVIVITLFALGAALGGVSLSVGHWLTLALVLIAGSMPFCALGLAVGCRVSSTAAVAVVNLIYLPMSVLSGLWVPLAVFPSALQTLALILPPYHLLQLGLKVIDMDAGQPAVLHLGVLVGYTAVFSALAYTGFRHLPRGG